MYLICIHMTSLLFPQNETNTFQGILISGSYSSYAVFIYKCGSMKWGGSVIGWQVGLRDYNSHYLSGKNNSNDIGCLYSKYYSAFAFRIDKGKREFGHHKHLTDMHVVS